MTEIGRLEKRGCTNAQIYNLYVPSSNRLDPLVSNSLWRKYRGASYLWPLGEMQ